MKTIISLLLWATILVSATSCIVENFSGGCLKGEESLFYLRLRTPGSYAGPAGRAMSLADENTIDDIYVLVFDRYNQLAAIRKGLEVTSSPGHSNPAYSGEGSFVVSVMPSKNFADTYKLIVLANAASILSATIGLDAEAIVNKGYEQVMAAIYGSITGKMYSSGGRIPMWGESGALILETGSSIQTMQLTRCIARIDVGVGALTYDGTGDSWAWDGKNTAGNMIPFRLADVYVLRPNNQYSVAPDVANLDGPTIPAGTTAFTVTFSENWFQYPATTSATGGFSAQDIFIPEADIKMGPVSASGDINHTNRMAVVVGGYYDGSATKTFYRLDFAINNNLIDVLRNHLYRFNISDVSGPGYPDVSTAYESMSMNMTVEIYEWDQMGMGEIFFFGTYYIMLQNSRNENRDDRRAIVYRNEGSNDVIVFRTNIPLGKFELLLDNGGYYPNPTDKTVVQNERFKVEMKEENGVTFFEFTSLKPYDSAATDNPSVLTVTTDAVKFYITVEQRDGGPGSWIDGGNTDKDF
ncbi:MAG: hypothetical protein FWE99_00725 [Bacteroidales bacterium]|nr:hypothetical protein [Bacteroidales bacterium]